MNVNVNSVRSCCHMLTPILLSKRIQKMINISTVQMRTRISAGTLIVVFIS